MLFVITGKRVLLMHSSTWRVWKPSRCTLILCLMYEDVNQINIKVCYLQHWNIFFIVLICLQLGEVIFFLFLVSLYWVGLYKGSFDKVWPQELRLRKMPLSALKLILMVCVPQLWHLGVYQWCGSRRGGPTQLWKALEGEEEVCVNHCKTQHLRCVRNGLKCCLTGQQGIKCRPKTVVLSFPVQ